ncbi:hypothetical protein KI387_025250, partial [Taxus chinensis]
MEDVDTAMADGEAGAKIGSCLEEDQICPGKSDDLAGSRGSKPGEKEIEGNEQPSLRNVLTDPLTGLLMDDAMVAQCGHSFGLRSLQRVLETNLCISCGVLVPPESLIPNYALRAAVEAYGREALMSRKILRGVSVQEQPVQPEVSECKNFSKKSPAQPNSCGESAEDGFHSKGDQDAFLVDDRVIIKANKHVQGYSVCRKAVITAKGLNGWYTVKTLDIGDSMQLPYHFLQKMGENDMTVDFESGTCLGELKDATPKVDHSDADKGKGRMLNGETSSNSCHELPGDQDESRLLGIDAYGFECENSEGHKGVSRSGEVPFQSSHVGGGANIYMGANHFSPEGTSGHSGADTDVAEIKRSKRGRGIDGPQAGGILGTQAGLDVLTVRSKRSSLVARASNMRSGCLTSSGPNRKAFISGVRKRSSTGNGTTHIMLAEKTREVSYLKTGDSKETEDVKNAVSNPGTIQMEVLHMIKKGMANLEKDIPWICFERVWKRQQSIWRKGLREASTLQDLGIKLQELRSSLLLASAGGMPDEEWEKQLNTAMDSENTDLLICFSPAGVTAAAAIAAAEAFSHDGSKNTEVLVKVPMKLIRQHNHHDLIVLREALEREKRHISAKLEVLKTKEYKNLNGFGESA